jgi:hypothetical protein
MNINEKREFVNEFIPQYPKFSLDADNNLIYLHNEQKVERLSILVECIKNENTMIFKFGEYEQLIPLLKAHSIIPNSDFRIYEIPNEMSKWVEFCFEHSASSWTDNLLLELADREIIEVDIIS